MQMISNVSMKGDLAIKVIRQNQTAPLSWRVRNTLRLSFLWGLITNLLAKGFSSFTGIPTMTAELSLTHIRKDGVKVHYGVVSRRVVTNAGAGFIVDAFQNGVELELMNYHGCGTGTTAEDASDTALVTESTTALNPDSTRATGTQSEPATNQYRTTGTLTFDASAAVTEHGVFNQSATGGGVLLDRSVFSAVNVASGDSIQFQYTLQINSGG